MLCCVHSDTEMHTNWYKHIVWHNSEYLLISLDEDQMELCQRLEKVLTCPKTLGCLYTVMAHLPFSLCFFYFIFYYSLFLTSSPKLDSGPRTNLGRRTTLTCKELRPRSARYDEGFCGRDILPNLWLTAWWISSRGPRQSVLRHWVASRWALPQISSLGEEPVA